MKKILLTIGLLICIWFKPLFADVDKGIDVREVQTLLVPPRLDKRLLSEPLGASQGYSSADIG